jgi:outer membrane autotransporter protein
MLAELGDWKITHLVHPEGGEADAADAILGADALLFYDMAGYTFADGTVTTRAPSAAFRDVITARFASGAGNEFTVHGTELGSDSVALNVGLSIQWNLQFNTYFSYSTEMGRDGYQLHNLNGGFRVNF